MAKTPAWQRKEGKKPSGGLNAKGRASYNAANPSKPGLPPAPNPKTEKDAARRKSFCARMSQSLDASTNAGLFGGEWNHAVGSGYTKVWRDGIETATTAYVGVPTDTDAPADVPTDTDAPTAPDDADEAPSDA